MNELVHYEQSDTLCQPIDLHMAKTETDVVDEEKKKKFSIESILGREESAEEVIKRVDFFPDRSLLQHEVLSPSSSLIHGKWYNHGHILYVNNTPYNWTKTTSYD